MLIIKNLSVEINNTKILNSLDLSIKTGEIHAIMGPNGSGKSTLSLILAGKDNYNIMSGQVFFKNKNLFSLNIEERARNGLFVSFQYPIEIPGVNNNIFLQTALNSIRTFKNLPILNYFEFLDFLKNKINLLKIPNDFLHRNVNVGFSGGEKKRNEILQMLILEPDLCILDEIDSGLDIDTLQVITSSINYLRNNNRSFIIITHYQRIFKYITPDHVHILHKGNIIKSGTLDLVNILEDKGYAWITK